MKKRSVIFILSAILVLIGSISYYNHSQKLYGNDKASIVKVIQSIEGYDEQPIEILEIRDFKDIRIVGFLYGENPAYIEFDRNEHGNYEWRYVEAEKDETFSTFLTEIHNKFMVVTNHQSQVAKMNVNVNGELVEQDFAPQKAGVTWMNLPDAENGSYTFREYSYFDGNGNRMTP